MYALADFQVNIRQADLKFTIQETSKFLHNENIYSLDDESLTNIFEVTEGWPAGLRLLGLSMGQETDTKEFLRTMHGDTRDIREYLMDEVLSRQSPETREYLLKTSILTRFCPSLCDALCGKKHRGEAFIQQIFSSNLFCISLDEQQTWVRYHHLFQNLLQVHLERRYNREEIKDLHKKASVWFEEQNYLEEALKYALKTDSPDEASEVILRHRQEMTDREQWYQLVKMLDLLPQEVIEHNPDLLILYARTLDKRGQYAEWEQVLNRAEVSLNSLLDRGSTYQRRLGEILLMRSTLYYHRAQGQNAIDATDKALQLLPLESNSERVYAKMINAASCQMIGDQKRAYENIHDALQREARKSPTYHGRLLQTLSFMHWIDGDMHSLKQSATAMLELCRTHNIPETKVYAQYFLGASLYQLNELDEIEHILTPVATNQYGPSFYMHMMSVQALSLTHNCLGQQDQALELSDSLVNTILKGEGASFLADAQALRVELALRQGLLSQAVHWAKEIKRKNAPPSYYFMIPELTIAKMYLSQATDDLLKQAEDLLDHLQDYVTSVHNTRYLVEVLSLKALLHDLLGNTMKAEEKLAEALNLAEPGGLIRIFVDLGAPMANILTRLTEHKTASVFAQKLLVEFEKYKYRLDTKKNSAPQVFSSEQEEGESIRLTNRENDILELLSQRMSDKEIAAHLLISYGTVKRHAANIYRKLDVKGRRQAVSKATELGIISQN